MYLDLSQVAIEHNDIRWANVLSALPTSQGGLPGLPSPFSGRTYNFRLIDFDQSRKLGCTPEEWDDYHSGYILRIVHGTRNNYVIEYWE